MKTKSKDKKKDKGGKAKAEKAVNIEKAVASPAHALASYYQTEVAAINKKMGLSAGNARNVRPISTGLLCADWVMNGGAYPMLSQVSGEEASGKSTLSMLTMASAVKSGVPIVTYFDGEGSIVPEYADNVLSAFDISNAFSSGRVNYQETTILENVTGYMSMLVRRLPVKRWSDEVNSWCYAIKKGDRDAANLIKAIEAAGLKADRAASTENWWMYPTDYDGVEAAVFLDSWPSFAPEAVDEKAEDGESGSVGMAMFARAMSTELPKFAGMLKARGVAFFTVNQLRTQIGVRYGDPEKEPGGQTLKFATSMRNRMYSRAVPPSYTKDPNNGRVCLEPSVTGEGSDVYAFKAINNVKSKVGRPFLKTMARVWISDSDGRARGFDPVFDTWHFLKTTGQIEGNFKSARLTLRTEGNRKVGDGLGQLCSQSIDYKSFKRLIVAEHFRDRDLLVSACKSLKLSKPPKLRNWLFDQIRSDKTLWSTDGSANTNELAE